MSTTSSRSDSSFPSSPNPTTSNSSSPSKIDFSSLFTPDYSSSLTTSKHIYNTLITSPSNLEHLLQTNLKTGIDTTSSSSMSWRINTYGTNHPLPEEPLSIWNIIISCFEDATLRVLLLSAVVSLIIGLFKDGIVTGWIEGFAIFTAVFIVVSISSYLNYNELLQFRILNAENKKKKALVIRNGNEIEIDYNDVLVGDLLVLKIGDIVDVDGLMIGDGVISLDESAINGESNLIKKKETFDDINVSSPIIISGSKVQDGYGKMIVCAVGANSFVGRNRSLIQSTIDNKNDETELTPLKKQLNDLAELIGNFGYISAVLIGVVMVVKDFIMKYLNGSSIISTSSIDVIVNAFIMSVTVIVVAIPEGLPMAVAIALAYSLQKMKHEHNLVKNLNSSEIMGNCNNVCTDKTGTLTLGEMTVESIWLKGVNYNRLSVDTDKNNEWLYKSDNEDIIYDNIVNNIQVVKTINEKGETVLNGDMTEKALYTFIEKYYTNHNKRSYGTKEATLPFKSDYKCMMSLYKVNDDEYILFVKGAYEQLKHYIQLTDTNDIESILTQYANESKRTLIFGNTIINKQTYEMISNNCIEKNFSFFHSLLTTCKLKFEFIIAISDPLRNDVPSSISTCKQAGITIRMVTGDNITTALSIAKQSGIITSTEIESIPTTTKAITNLLSLNKPFTSADFDSPIALDGETFRKLSGNITKQIDTSTGKIKSIHLNDISLFAKTVSNLKLIARASPEDKYLLVFGLKKLNNIVAVTGDGTNDAPALKQAHVGFAMGKRGTDIAKEAADIILLDDSFSSIVTACKFGRNVYDSIRKFIQFQLTTNIVAVFITLIGGLFLKDSPLNCIEMLWVNLIMDSLASLALASENPTNDLLKRKPYKRDDSLLTKAMVTNIITQALFQIGILIVILNYGDVMFNVTSDRELEHFVWNESNGYHFTIFFDVFVFLQVFNSINARKLRSDEVNVFKGIMNNAYYICVQMFIIIGQIAIVTFGGRAVRVKRLSIVQHCQCIIIASMSLLFGVIVRSICSCMKEYKYKVKVSEDKKRN